MEARLPIEKEKNSQKSKANNRILIGILILFLLGGGIGILAAPNIIKHSLDKTPTQPNSITPSSSPVNSPILSSPNTIIYGVWNSNSSVIKSYNMQTGTESVLAILPQNIKKVTMVLPDSLYYINNTDKYDHGTEIVKYTITNQHYQTVTKANNGLGIDDYYLSPNSNYLTTWEVHLNTDATDLEHHTVLWGGQSTVYGIDLMKGTKNLLYNEDGKSVVHYPRGVTNNGIVITDKFLPNSGPGWAYGMSSVSVSGAGNYDSAQMINGTYGRQPRISSDGTQLAFAGYNGQYGPGVEEIDSGNTNVGKVRRAVLEPDTVEIVSSSDLKRKKLLTLSNANVIDDVKFDKSGKYLFVTILKKDTTGYTPHILLYNLQNNSPEAVPQSANKRGLAYISDSQILLSTPDATSATMGNLGETYQFVNKNFEIVNPSTQKSVVLPITDINLQYIGIFSNSELPSAITEPDTHNQGKNSPKKTLQLDSFSLKPSLFPDRTALESKPLNKNSSVKGAKTIAQANPSPANPTQPNPTKTNTTPANPTPANPTPANPTPANPTQPNPTQTNPTQTNPTINLTSLPSINISQSDYGTLEDLKRQTEELIKQTKDQPDVQQLLNAILDLINFLESMIQN